MSDELVGMRFRAIPLTPIHVGDGEVISADRYHIREPEKLEDWQLDEMDEEDPRIAASERGEPELVLFEPAAVVGRLSPAQRATFVKMLDAGQLHGALDIVRQAARSENNTARIALSQASLSDLKPALRDPKRRGDVHGFIRSAGCPFLPGSTVKGALRTACLNAFANDPTIARSLNEAASAALARRDAFHQLGHDRLEAIALDRQAGATERDPLRNVRVADAPLSPGATLIDKVVNCRRDDGGIRHNDMQMHFERLRSLADQDDVRTFDLLVTVDSPTRQERRRDLDREKAPSRDLDLAIILAAMKQVHERLWQDELDRFWRRHQPTERMLTALWRRCYRPDDPRHVLLRVGRFAHFEAKSVERYRRGVQEIRRPGRPAERRAIVQGSTRGAILARDCYLPLGWLLLVRAD
jgi:CRISPR-associated protein Csm5